MTSIHATIFDSEILRVGIHKVHHWRVCFYGSLSLNMGRYSIESLNSLTHMMAQSNTWIYLNLNKHRQPNTKRPVNPLKRFTGRLFHLHSNHTLLSVLALPIRGCRASLHWFAPRWRSSLVRFPTLVSTQASLLSTAFWRSFPICIRVWNALGSRSCR